LGVDLDEDIQIHTKESVTKNDIKLLLIEVKGIGGTSRDSECSQIDKHVKRRGRERKAYDVQGIYIVNHQKHLPPHKREKIPFSENQIIDAQNSERGLVTTYQLYNLYSDIVNNIITKEEARLCFYQYGFIEFTPSNLVSIGFVTEFLQKPQAFIIEDLKTTIKTGDKLFIKKGTRFQSQIIESIQVNDENVESVDFGEVGVKSGFTKLKEGTEIFIQNNTSSL
jgi:hypothetical protein